MVTSHIKRTEVDETSVRDFKKEDQHVAISLELAKETALHVLLFAEVLPGDHGAWNRNGSILCGHMVRLGKLMTGMLSEVAENRQELAGLYIRLIAECIVNLRYLIKKDSSETYDSYVLFSLRYEKALLERIDMNIAERGDEEWGIEKRMRRSIMASFHAVNIDPNNVDSSDRSNWGGDSIHARCKEVGLQPIYLSLFSGSSHLIHGNWEDLYHAHLIQRADGLFLPNTNWERPCPQPINVTSLFAVEAMA